MFLLVFKEKSGLLIGNFTWQVGHKKQKNNLFDNLQESAVHKFKIYLHQHDVLQNRFQLCIL